jgi:hypothetical protein
MQPQKPQKTQIVKADVNFLTVTKPCPWILEMKQRRIANAVYYKTWISQLEEILLSI